jgi:hypothetical protein
LGKDVLYLSFIRDYLMGGELFPPFMPASFGCNPGAYIHFKQRTLEMTMHLRFSFNQQGKLRFLASMSGFSALPPNL